MTTCQVCDEGVDVARHTPKKLFKGVVYHFCSTDCRDTFGEAPQEHVSLRPGQGFYP